MKTWTLILLPLAILLAGCDTIPPGAERGPHRTMAYTVLIEASEPGAKIEANGQVMGNTPIQLKVFGDPDGTFHDFGSYYFTLRALPLATNQFVQTRYYRTGRGLTPEDFIPQKVYFDMNQNTPDLAPPLTGPPAYYYGPPVFYPDPFFFGPSFRFHIGPRFHHHRR
jgi:hypothetical protein